jgi:hypothetical protein
MARVTARLYDRPLKDEHHKRRRCRPALCPIGFVAVVLMATSLPASAGASCIGGPSGLRKIKVQFENRTTE